MNPTNTFWNKIGLAEAPPDISFTLLEKTSGTVYNYSVTNNKRLKSNGSVQTLLEMHSLMSNSLSLLHPLLFFTPDFPDYIMPRDSTNALQQYPTLGENANVKMPHHRNDLFQRNYSEYQGITKVPAPHITWGVVRQEPGTMGGPPFQGTQELKPRSREFVSIFGPEIKKYIGSTGLTDNFTERFGRLVKFVEIKGQAFDNLVQYNIWARTAWEAEELVEWFQNYLLEYTGMFREAGIVQMVFDRRVRDDTLMQIKNKYHLRSFLYYIRTEHINLSTIKPIRRIGLDVFTEAVLPSIDPNDYVVDKNNKLLEKWHSLNNVVI